MRRWLGRMCAIGALAAAVAAAFVAVLAALGAPTSSVSQASAAAPTTSVERRAHGAVCFTVAAVPSTHTCVPGLAPTEIHYASTGSAIGGVAGSSVRAVIVKLTKKGTVWATLKDGAFFAAVPAGYRMRAVVKVLAGGRRVTFPVR